MAQVFRFIALAAAGAALTVAAPLQAKSIEGWEVARGSQGSCMMTATFDDKSITGITIALVWDKAKDQLGFLAASQHWNGLLESEGDPTALQLTFDGQVAYPQWLYEGARFQYLGTGTEAVMGVWGEEHRELLADALTGSSNVSLVIGDTDLGEFDISGADAAYRELMRCGDRG
jgi:hypothetical protein